MPENNYWRQKLSAAQYKVLREHGTECAGSSELNSEYRQGNYHCAGCDNLLFNSSMKYDSGTGWPSFFAAVAGSLATSEDYKLATMRIEYHCKKCGAHQGHLFDDGPAPTFKRYCNNGIALIFKPL